MKTKKLLSVVLIALMLLSCIPIFASAATQIALKATHVTEWPTAEGEIYYGEPLSKINLVGGKVVYEGVEVPGHFEHVDPAATAENAMEGYEADIKFVPDDTATYKGFTKYYSKTTFNVHKATPVLADESKPPVVNGTVDAGVTLSTITISDGAMVNPYNADETYAKKATWKWSNPDTVVSKSGYYEAKFVAGSVRYVTLTQNIWVEVYKEIPLSVISELPIIETFNYNPSITWADVEIKGGKAVIENDDGTTTEINGVFSFSNEHLLNTVPSVGTFELDVVFTPENSEEALPCNFRIPVTVNKGQIKFVDADGNDIIPEIKTIPGVLLEDKSSIADSLFDYLECKRNSVAFFDMEGNSVDGSKVPVGRHQYQVYVTTKDTNYEPAMLTFFLTLEPTYFNVTTRYNYVNKYLTVVPDNKNVSDEFDVWVDGELIGTTTGQKIKWATDESRDYNVTLVHKDTTEGVYALANTEYTMTVNIPRQIFRSDSGLSFTATGSTYPSNDNYAYKGDVLTLTCTDETFYNWQLSIGGEDWLPEGLTEEDLKKPTITFTMPDSDIFACPNDESRFAAAADCDHLCHSENPIYQMFWKILHFIFRLFNVQQYCDCGMKHYESPLFNF